MLVRDLHPWRVSYRDAVAIQEHLRSSLQFVPPETPPRWVAGTDVSFSVVSHRMYAAVVVLELPTRRVVEVARAIRLARFPYIPGLFAFRELPPLLSAFRKLRHTPDLILCDGHGLAHPRRFGLACHAGLLLDRPAIGCAKSRLVGTHGPLGRNRGAVAALIDEAETIGAAVRTREGVEPMYVSPGHRVDLASSVRIVLEVTSRFRVPEPTRLAHRETNEMRCRMDGRLRPPPHRTYPDFVSTAARG